VFQKNPQRKTKTVSKKIFNIKNGSITKEQFDYFVNLFFVPHFPRKENGKNGENLLNYISEIQKQSYFLGYRSRQDTEQFLKDHPNRSNFVIRICNLKKFCVSKMTSDKPEHMEIEPEHFYKNGLLEYIDKEIIKKQK